MHFKLQTIQCLPAEEFECDKAVHTIANQMWEKNLLKKQMLGSTLFSTNGDFTVHYVFVIKQIVKTIYYKEIPIS